LITNRILKGISYQVDNTGTYYASCNSALYPSLFIRINGYYAEITPNNYLLASNVANTCIVGFMINGDDSWLLGDVFLRNFYAIFDEGNT
jgi:gastricsin